MNTKKKGDIAEFEVLTFLARNGYSVSIPFGENNPYDLIVESPSTKLYRIQTRSCSWKNEVLIVSLRSTLRIEGKNTWRPLDTSRIEAFAAWDGSSVYIIPTHSIKATQAISIRRQPAKSGREKGINKSEDFFEAVHLIP